MEKNRKLVSIIVPAYKQKNTVKRDVLRIKGVMQQLGHDFEIIIVIDGRNRILASFQVKNYLAQIDSSLASY